MLASSVRNHISIAIHETQKLRFETCVQNDLNLRFISVTYKSNTFYKTIKFVVINRPNYLFYKYLTFNRRIEEAKLMLIVVKIFVWLFVMQSM